MHWHFTRTTVDPHSDDADIALYFCMTRFPSAGAAAEAVSRDVVKLYPLATRNPAFADVLKKMPELGSRCYYLHNPCQHVKVMWRLVECEDRDCQATYRTYQKQAHAAVIDSYGPDTDITYFDPNKNA